MINIPILDNPPFGDDYHHIFNFSFVTDAPHPFVYFNPWSHYFKSWGFSYFVIWILYKCFGGAYVYYHFFNLLLHFTNYLILQKLLQRSLKFNQYKSRLYSLFFLFNPLSVFTVAWIFQLKTLLSVLFILLTLMCIYSFSFKKWYHYGSTILVFFLSLTSKVSGILLPFYIIVFIGKKITLKRMSLLMTPLLCLSLFYGLLNIKGITYIVKEVKNIEKPVAELNIDHVIKLDEYLDLEIVHSKEKGTNFEINIYDEVTDGAKKYLLPILNTSTFFDKHIISLQNLSKLVLFTFGLNQYFPFYENNLETSKSYFLYFHITLGLMFLFLTVLSKNHFFYLAICLFLPISGYFYVPYMKFSYTSDHWFYPASFAILLGTFKYIKNKKIPFLLFVLVFSNYLYTTIGYYDFRKTLINNYAHIPNKIIIDHIATYKNARNQKKIDIQTYHQLLSKVDFNNTQYYRELHKLGLEKNKLSYVKYHFPRFAADQIRTENQRSLNGFTLLHSSIYSMSTIDAIKSLQTIHTQDISTDQYQRVERLLKNSN